MRALAWDDEGVDDRALVSAVLGGDRDAFGTLVARETAAVYRICLRILGVPADAEDASQEAFVTAYRSLSTFRGDGSLRGWLLRIATRLAFRRLSSRRPVVAIDEVAEDRLADRATEPSRVVLGDERDRELRDAVASLPDTYREVVALRFFAELSLAEIAEATGRPVNTVKTHLRRGLERLRPLVVEEVPA